MTSSGTLASKSSFNSKPKVLYAVDSVGHSASARKLENFTNSRIKTVRAHSSVYNKKVTWPEKNFDNVVTNALKNPGLEQYEVVVLSAPTVDITSLDTSQLKPSDNTEYLQQETVISSTNMFKLAIKSLKQNPKLDKVIIMEHPPRFDQIPEDPTSLKPKLVSLANATLNKLWLNSNLKHKIAIGQHCQESEGTGRMHRYTDIQNSRYEGVQLYSKSDDYTRSVGKIMISVLPLSKNLQGDHKT